MLRRLLRCTALSTAIVMGPMTMPSTASAQVMVYSSCATPGICGGVEAFFVGTLLSVRLSNNDNTLGSALYTSQIIFASALNAANLGTAFTNEASASPSGSTTSIGNTPANGWSFGGVGGSNVLDLSAFFNSFIEGSAASAFRASPGDPDNGTWVTTNGYVEFTADMAGVEGLTGNNIVGLGYCTEYGCDGGAAVVATPEPATLALFATGLVAVAVIRRRRKSGFT